ncbi:DUF4276 family protein [Polyangium aurulentum]|uniref:DUF4276 family protein n=1 Tax=Polyangium aurulentum TaxID=2567896 RepID=UPI0010AECBD9|nr:DUF4276 family protein [Polyangium aurulentum]UQA54615.1 DUF4276 family protein [Polyangium aurulentum]
MRSVRIGLLAEDDTDCDALEVLVRRLAIEINAIRPGFKKFGGHGAARLRNKAEPTLREMVREGCTGAVLVHDLDRDPINGQLNDARALRADLQRIAVPPGLSRLICIPVEELEAWFWSDPEVIQHIGRDKGKASVSPHLIKKPKEALINLSRGANRKPRYRTSDNPRLAERLNLSLCAQRCPSFRELRDFIRGIVDTAA